jgi:hypothetical protein
MGGRATDRRGALLAVIARPTPGTSRETRALDSLLLRSWSRRRRSSIPMPSRRAGGIAPSCRWIPLGPYMGDHCGWVVATLGVSRLDRVFTRARDRPRCWCSGRRKACALGMPLRIVRHIAFAGLVAALVALAEQAAGDPALIYGRWPPRDVGARPVGRS